tara:strand:+ start:317 stop:547 length:231 start_codon:yes stop_codon:yes gene_type:complete
MYVKHLQEYLDQFTNGTKGNAISNAEIYMETSTGKLERIRRIEVQESNLIGVQGSIRIVLKSENMDRLESPTFNKT